MVARARIHAVDIDTPFADLLPRLAMSPYTRLPVYRGSIDRIVGMINTKQLALRQLRGTSPTTLAELIKPIITVPESLAGDRLIATFRERRAHLAIVVDAVGRVVGLVTLDDLLTDLLGTRDDAPPGAAGPRSAVR
jgi:putative hemolysin